MKTVVEILKDVHQSELKAGDIGYVDGYVRMGDDRGYAVVVREDDGLIDAVPLYLLRAIQHD